MQIVAFLYSCKFTYESSDYTILVSINACVEKLNMVLASCAFDVQLLPLAKPLYDLYNRAYAKLLKDGLKDNAKNLEELRYRIFVRWTRIH